MKITNDYVGKETKTRTLILDLLKYRGRMSKCQLSYYSGEPYGFVSDLVDDLMEESLIDKEDLPADMILEGLAVVSDNAVYRARKKAA